MNLLCRGLVGFIKTSIYFNLYSIFRTSAGADSFFMVQKLLCNHEEGLQSFLQLLVLCVLSGSFVSQKTYSSDPPIKIDLFAAMSSDQDPCSSLCARIQVRNSFAIYDSDIFEQISEKSVEDPPAWLEVEAIVIDESNFTTCDHWRKLVRIALPPLMQ